MFDPTLVNGMSRNSGAVRTWVLLWLQGRRRKRQAELVPSGPPIPAAPSDLQGEDLSGVVGLTWELTGVQFADGISIEARKIENGQEFAEVGTTGPTETEFQFDAQGFSAWQCRIRAFNAAGYSDYSDWIEVDLI
jgi:hypothetical protein